MPTSPRKKQKTTKELKLGLVGCGTVGGGCLEVLHSRREFFSQLGFELNVTRICVQNIAKKRSHVPKGCQISTSFNDILSDKSIDIVVEVCGGTTDAKDVVLGAIEQGKHVVTANKALLAEHLPEIQQALAKHPEVRFGWEAAVCGGIPIIHSLQRDLLGDHCTKIAGIMNGTTNYMLSKMEAEGSAYADVLKEAQDLGFAEAIPTADVEGFDVRAKIALLSKLALGSHVEVSRIPTTGITSITKYDFKYAHHLNSTIKLLGMAEILPNGDLSIMVSPMLVPKDSLFASIAGATNAVSVASTNLGTSFLVGPGAGGLPTANSVVSDLIAVAQEQSVVSNPFPKQAEPPIAADFEGCFYIRFMVKDQLGIFHHITKACTANNISVDQIVQIPPEPAGWDRACCPFVLLTDKALYSQVKKACAAMGTEDWNVTPPFFMPKCELK